MSLRVNLTELEKSCVALQGELEPAALELDDVDELIRLDGPLIYNLVVGKLPRDLEVKGELTLMLRCECARCLRPFRREMHWATWEALLPLVGEEKIARDHEWVDLTPYIREDILLGFPQHPLCEEDCPGLTLPDREIPAQTRNGSNEGQAQPSAWAELNKLKL